MQWCGLFPAGVLPVCRVSVWQYVPAYLEMKDSDYIRPAEQRQYNRLNYNKAIDLALPGKVTEYIAGLKKSVSRSRLLPGWLHKLQCHACK